MNTDYTDNTEGKQNHLIYKDLTYKINGVLFEVHKQIGPYGKEKQYVDLAYKLLKEKGLSVEKEKRIGDSGNIIDLLVENLVPLEFKAKRILTKEDFYQTQRYLQQTGLKLAILANFRCKLVKPKRILKIDNWRDRDSLDSVLSASSVSNKFPHYYSEYAKSGVNYQIMEPFKMAMIEAGKKTLHFPEKRDVFIVRDAIHAHGAVFEYRGNQKHIWCKTQEDLGNKNWIAEWMYQETGKTYYDAIAIDTALIVVNDVIAQGALPVVFNDQLEASSSEWYGDEKRAKDFANGLVKICEEVGMALPAGESASCTYLINPKPPVKQIATLSGSVTGIVAPADKLVTGRDLQPGDHIIAVASSGLHANGISLVIKKGLELKDQFLSKLPNGHTLGEEALIPTRSYVKLIEELQKANVQIHALLPGTGDGVGKIAFDKRPFTYRIHSWLPIPPLMQFFRDSFDLPIVDLLKTFNWGAGYYIYSASDQVDQILSIGRKVGYELADVGVVEEGKRQTIFEPEKITLTPPGE